MRSDLGSRQPIKREQAIVLAGERSANNVITAFTDTVYKPFTASRGGNKQPARADGRQLPRAVQGGWAGVGWGGALPLRCISHAFCFTTLRLIHRLKGSVWVYFYPCQKAILLHSG